ncbi:MAG: DUF1302 family protein [Myxococcota bacterium]
MTRTTAVALVAALLWAAPPARAQEDLDEILGGFDDIEQAPSTELEPDEPPLLPGWLEVNGALSLGAAYGLWAHRTEARPHDKSYNGPNRLRAKLDLELEAELFEDWEAKLSGFGFYDAIFALRDRTSYDSRARERYERELELQEAWVRGRLHDHVDLKVGRQVLNWGRSDTLRVIDVINPLDNRDPGLVDIENLRRPVGMVRLDTFFGDWTLTGLVIPEVRTELLPAYGSDFVASPTPLPRTDAPRHWGDDPEFGGALMGVFRGWDVSFHALRYWTNLPRLDFISQPLVPPPPLEFRHDRRTLVGAGGNLTLGNWLLKTELAWIDAVHFAAAEDSERFDAMGGIEYYGFDDVVVALEVVNRHLMDYELAAKRFPDYAEEDSLETALRVTADLMNARLHLTALGVVFGERGQNGMVHRLEATWDLRDALSVTGGALIYVAGKSPSPANDWSRNDRLFVDLEWSF